MAFIIPGVTGTLEYSEVQEAFNSLRASVVYRSSPTIDVQQPRSTEDLWDVVMCGGGLLMSSTHTKKTISLPLSGYWPKLFIK